MARPNVNASDIGTYMQRLKGRYTKNWLGTTKSARTGKSANLDGHIHDLDIHSTSPEQAIAMFNDRRYVDLVQLPEITEGPRQLRFLIYRDNDDGSVFAQVHAYVAHNTLSGITDVVELEGQERDELVAAVPGWS